jgi:hypothetical protein
MDPKILALATWFGMLSIFLEQSYTFYIRKCLKKRTIDKNKRIKKEQPDTKVTPWRIRIKYWDWFFRTSGFVLLAVALALGFIGIFN